MKVLIDTETTGLLKGHRDFFGQPGIVQLGAVRLDDDLKEVAYLNMMVNPEIGKWEEKAIETHGITPNMVADAPTFFEAGRVLAEFCLGCDVFGGYNVKFDKDVIWWQLLRYGLEKNFPWPLRDVDVMKRVSKMIEMQGKRGVKFPTLGEAYNYCFKHDFDGAHDALSDIRATAEIWRFSTLYLDGDDK